MALTSILTGLFGGSSSAAEGLKVGSPAPTFKTQIASGEAFNMANRKGKWTVLYFYPKADTPGCTKQACAFRDSIKVIHEKGAEVFGVSKDSVESQKKFTDKYHLNFPLLADPEGKIIQSYGVAGMVGFAKRWTFLIDPELKIRSIMENVDPALNAHDVATELEKLQKK